MFIGGGNVVAADTYAYPIRTRAFQASEFTGGFRRMTGISGTGAGANTTGPVPSWVPGSSSIDGIYHVAEGVDAVAKHLTSKNWWERIGKMGLAIMLIALALVFINRKKLEQAGKTAGKAALVAAK